MGLRHPVSAQWGPRDAIGRHIDGRRAPDASGFGWNANGRGTIHMLARTQSATSEADQGKRHRIRGFDSFSKKAHSSSRTLAPVYVEFLTL